MAENIHLAEKRYAPCCHASWADVGFGKAVDALPTAHMARRESNLADVIARCAELSQGLLLMSIRYTLPVHPCERHMYRLVLMRIRPHPTHAPRARARAQPQRRGFYKNAPVVARTQTGG